MKKGGKPNNELSPGQAKVMSYICEFVSANGRFPGVVDHIKSGQSRTAWHTMILLLRAKGYMGVNSKNQYIIIKPVETCSHCKGAGFLHIDKKK